MTQHFKDKVHEVIFGHETKAGKAFDVLLLWAILLSVLVVFLDSIESYHENYGKWLYIGEWIFTILFTFEYIARLYVSRPTFKYIFSFYGLVDLLSIIPTYFSLFFPATQYLITLRTLRMLRIFRILKLSRYLDEAELIVNAMKASRRKILVFLFAIVNIVVIVGTIMYLVEGTESGFSNIPKSIYWAIVTITTVGFGDIVPQTAFGQLISSILMIMGYAFIAVPTGIVTAEFSREIRNNKIKPSCPRCGTDNDKESNFCKSCGHKL